MQWDVCPYRGFPHCSHSWLCFYDGDWRMDGWVEVKQGEGVVYFMDWLFTLCIHLSLSHFQSQYFISTHVLSHRVRNQSFSLPLSLPLHLWRSQHHLIRAIRYQSNTLAVGTNERVSPLSNSNHITSLLNLLYGPPRPASSFFLYNWAKTSAYLSAGAAIQMLQFILQPKGPLTAT